MFVGCQFRPARCLATLAWNHIKPYKMWFVIFAVCALAAGFWAVLNAVLIKHLIDSLNDNASSLRVGCIGLLIVLNLFLHECYWRMMQYINIRLKPVIKNEITRQSFSYAHQHAHQFFQDNLSGRVASQVTTLTEYLAEIIHEYSRQILRGVSFLIVALISLYQVHIWFFCGLLMWFISLLLIAIKFSGYLVNLSSVHADAESVVSGRIVDSLSNAQNVRLFAMSHYERSHLNQYLSLTKAAFRRKEWFVFFIHAFLGVAMTLMLLFMVWAFLVLKRRNLITIGDIALIINVSFDVAWALWYTLEQVDLLNIAVGKCKQSVDFLFRPLTIVDDPQATQLVVSKGAIEWENVTFHYKGNMPLFHQQSVRILPGQKVGLVGYSGGGKSTFVHLILRFYEVTDGRILIDGQDIKSVTQDSLHQHVAMIPQDPSLFHRSLVENIRYARMDATDADVIDAAKKANAHNFIIQLPDGYNSMVGERGVKLSGGQRQRIAIARAILRNAPILILDEATSQLDSMTESGIQESLWEVMQGKTTLVVAHRLSTLLHMDRIIVLNEGRVAEDGTHQELLAQNGIYKNLWDAQIGDFLGDARQHSMTPPG